MSSCDAWKAFMVSQVLHEHAASLSAASHANRSRRLTKCAKDSGHYPFLRLAECSYAKVPRAAPRDEVRCKKTVWLLWLRRRDNALI
jgi:hypothetical protein